MMLLLLILPTSNGSTKRPYKVMYTNAYSTYHKGRYRSLVHLLTISLSVFWPANLGCRLLYLQSLVTFMLSGPLVSYSVQYFSVRPSHRRT